MRQHLLHRHATHHSVVPGRSSLLPTCRVGPCGITPTSLTWISLTIAYLVGTPAAGVASYPYTRQLERIASRSSSPSRPLPPHVSDVSSPIQIQFWYKHLQHHPDRQFAELILTGLSQGFRIGFNSQSRHRPTASNHISVIKHPDVVSAYIQDEVARGQVGHVGPQELSHLWQIHVSPLGAIPKKNSDSGKWRLIMDLYLTEGAKCQRRHSERRVHISLRIGRSGCHEVETARPRLPNGKDGHPKGIQKHSSRPKRSEATRLPMAVTGLCRQSSTIRSPLSSFNFLSHGWCTAVDNGTPGCILGDTLRGRLFDHWSP